MATMYVVMCSTGEYSDRNERSVCAYVDEGMARQHVELAGAQAREIEMAISADRYADDDRRAERDEFQALLRQYFADGECDEARYEELSAKENAEHERWDDMRRSNPFDKGETADDRTYFLYSVELRDSLPTPEEAP